MSDEPLNDLEQLLIDAATDPGARKPFQNALLAADVYAVPLLDEVTGEIRNIAGVRLENDSIAAAIFTDPVRLRAVFGADAPIRTFKGREVLEKYRSTYVYLNYSHSYCVWWAPQDIASILDGFASHTITESTQILLGRPADVPHELIAALKAQLQADKMVKGAWLSLASGIPDCPPQSLLLGVDYAGDWQAVQAAVGRAVQNIDLTKRPLNVMNINKTSLSRSLRNGIPIIPPRKFGFFNLFR